MAVPSQPFGGWGGAPVPGDEAAPRPRFPWISLVVVLLALVGVAVAVGLGIAAGAQANTDHQRAMDEAVRITSDQTAEIPVTGPTDVLHLFVAIPADAAAWTANGSLVYPDDRPFHASQDGTPLVLEDQLSLYPTYDDDNAPGTLADGSSLVKIDDVHPRSAGTVQIETGDLSPGDELRIEHEPTYPGIARRLVVAGTIGGISVVIGLGAAVTFLVMLLRRHRPKPRPPAGLPSYVAGSPSYPVPHPLYGGAPSPYPGYPYPYGSPVPPPPPPASTPTPPDPSTTG